MKRTPKPDEFNLHATVTPSVQLRTLRTVFEHVVRAATSGNIGVVEVDLDLCGLMPVFRTREGLRRTGQEFGIREFSTPESLPILPGYSDEAWLAFVDLLELPSAYPRLPWKENGKAVRAAGSPFGRFHELYWTSTWLQDDIPTPGLGVFSHRIAELGGQVVFISGRWLKAHTAPSLACLHRAGIPQPALVIGNAWHVNLAAPGGKILSDAEIKAQHQDEIRKEYGTPIAIIDDRKKNRDAIVGGNVSGILSIAIALPGFTCDPATAHAPLRLSTFETFDSVLGQIPTRPYMLERYSTAGLGQPWRGIYEGLGRNQLAYFLPRMTQDEELIESLERPYAELVGRTGEGSLSEEALLEACVASIPKFGVEKMTAVLSEAETLAQQSIAAPYPVAPEDRHALWLSLVTSWLHSRDIEFLMKVLSYEIPAAGVHDLEEYVSGAVIKAAIGKNLADGKSYSDWLPRWIETVSAEDTINVGFLNPHLLVSTWQWIPSAKKQDAMDVHRCSSHHDGDGQEFYDPIEAAVNNLLHQREGRHGIRKEPVVAWHALKDQLATETGAENLCKNSAARDAIRDIIALAPTLEQNGFLTPWGLVAGAGFK